eukprot:11196317-Prorocentrum_lima.AAC.1
MPKCRAAEASSATSRGTRFLGAGMCTTGSGVSQVATTILRVPSPAAPCRGSSARYSSTRRRWAASP